MLLGIIETANGLPPTDEVAQTEQRQIIGRIL